MPLYLFMVVFITSLGVFPNVASEQLIFKSMNLGKCMYHRENHMDKTKYNY